MERIDLLYGVDPGPAMLEWDWVLAPFGEEARDRGWCTASGPGRLAARGMTARGRRGFAAGGEASTVKLLWTGLQM